MIFKNLKDKNILYILSNQAGSGVYLKVKETLSAAEDLGYDTSLFEVRQNSKYELFRCLKIVLQTDFRYIILRDFGNINLIFLPFLLLARIQGKFLILDIPTPYKGSIGEILLNFQLSKWVKLRSIFFMYMNGPWSLWVYNLIVQYGDEMPYFEFFNKKRTVLLGNGINPNRITAKRIDFNLEYYHSIQLVGVATIQPYNGYDRIVKAMYERNIVQRKNPQVFFHIVGAETKCSEELKQLVIDLGLKNWVIFHGPRDQKFISKLYDVSHLAVSSIGFFRINLNSTSNLKSREYCLAGIPFIATGHDVDFETHSPFRFVVSNDEKIDQLLEIFDKFPDNIKNLHVEDIRKYATTKLTYTSKLIKLGFKDLKLS
jgi:glycosyltransferase involved in cell wall biosynthesis